MATLEPLTVFTTHPQSQHYIKSTADESDSVTTIETTFDLTLKITKTTPDETQPTIEAFLSTEQQQSNEAETKPRHYRIFPDYDTDFITRSTSDTQPDEDCDVEAGEVLEPLPASVRERYKAWVGAYNGNYKKRVVDTGDEEAAVFGTVEEEVAWCVAGFLLAWRVTFAPQIGSVQYGPGRKRYFVPGERQLPATMGFLKDQVELLESGKPSI